MLIVGAGQGGAQTAIALRREGFEGSILIVGSEPHLPYERPPLSKDYLTGRRSFEQIHIRPRECYEARDIGLRLGATVMGVDPDQHSVTLGDGTGIGYGSLIWATGGTPCTLDIPGRDLPGVHTIRTRSDIDRLRSALPRVRDVVVIGGGFIGLESAAALHQLDKQVRLVELENQVLARVAAEPWLVSLRPSIAAKALRYTLPQRSSASSTSAAGCR